MEIVLMSRSDENYPKSLIHLRGHNAPAAITMIGDPTIMRCKKLGLICSVRCPGSIVLKTFDAIRDLRDAGITVIGGFHSPMEKECLGLLLRGTAPVIICPARNIENMRITAEWKGPCAERRLLILSSFGSAARRVTTELAAARNEFVAVMSDALFVPHASLGGKTEQLIKHSIQGVKPVYTVADSENAHLLASGIQPLAVADLAKAFEA